MIKKISKIKDFAVFKDFEWDKSVLDKNERPITFGDINIIYGRNYSGKTTLSRIVRSLETKTLSEKYGNGTFQVELESGITIGQEELESFTQPIRVFNEDFVRDKLLFINSPEDGVKPFAVLGDNAEIEREIQQYQEQLGVSTEGEETNLYLEQKNARIAYTTANETYKREQLSLDKRLSEKATDRKHGIKYLSNIYGDQNYTVLKLKAELDRVSESDRLSEEEVEHLKLSLQEKNKQIPTIYRHKDIDFNQINAFAREVVERPIMTSDKIEALVHNAMANKWVEEGCKLHKKGDACLFCGGDITGARWEQLERHYDESTRKLSEDIDKTIRMLENNIEEIFRLYTIQEDGYYQRFQVDILALKQNIKQAIAKCTTALSSILEQLKKRKDNIHTVIKYDEYTFDVQELDAIYAKIQDLTKQATQYGAKLDKQHKDTQAKLRLSEVARFKEEIGYVVQLQSISKLNASIERKKNKKESIEKQVSDLEKLIKGKERLRQNEEEGAVKVNKILKNYFGHRFIELRAVQDSDGVYFDVYRKDEKAFNLSEGERNLVAFAYFIAKLEDVDTINEQPIIWIDDPISSLDSNHVFFIFSLIDQQIVSCRKGKQVFISTHNLDFLRYLKRLHVDDILIPYISKNGENKERKTRKCWFILERLGDSSTFHIMPTYMKEHVTEFNYLFHQIYKCVQDSERENYELFYSFGNNARKFLEAYLYYKYPDNEKDHLHKKLKRFFSDVNAATTIDRIDNELSHLEGLLERGMSIIDIPEIKRCAQFILDAIKTKDPEQYESFKASIGE